MLYFGRAKTALILGICVLGALLCLPNLLPAPAPWLPWRQVHLGLDLRGGSYLLLQVDMDAVRKEREGTILDRARQALAGKYRTIAEPAGESRIAITLRDPTQLQPALDALKTIAANPDGTQDFDVHTQPDGALSLTLNEAALRARATAAVQQSIEIVRRRIDATGVLDPQITRQGDNRIVVQLPGVDDPEPYQAAYRHDGQDDVPPGGRSRRPEPPRAARRRPSCHRRANARPRNIVIRRRVEVDGAIPDRRKPSA